MSEITHWDMVGEPDYDPRGILASFVDDQVYQALQEFSADMTMLIGTGPKETWEDRVFVHLADERPPADGETPKAIGKVFSLREEILGSFNEVPIAEDNEAAAMLKMAEHLEAIAQCLRSRAAQVPPV